MLKQIDTTVPLPKYYQISESIKANIAGDKYKVGEKLPRVQFPKVGNHYATWLLSK